MVQQPSLYPIQFSVEYPDRPLDRFSSFFRIIAIIPISIVLGLVTGGNFGEEDAQIVGGLMGGLVFFAPLLMILFRRKYPRWWFDWNIGLMKFENRVTAYLFLLRDEYPSTDEEQTVHLEVPYPDVEGDLNQWLPLVKWFLAIPHYIVLAVLSLVLIVVVIVVWFVILFSRRYPRSLFDFVVGVMRWYNRVIAYAFILATDRYPPFSFSP